MVMSRLLSREATRRVVGTNEYMAVSESSHDPEHGAFVGSAAGLDREPEVGDQQHLNATTFEGELCAACRFAARLYHRLIFSTM